MAEARLRSEAQPVAQRRGSAVDDQPRGVSIERHAGRAAGSFRNESLED